MSAQELRDAAERLRNLAEDATAGPWVPWEQHGRDISDEGWSQVGVKSATRDVALTYPTGFEHDQHEADAEFIAAMHPGVALALADWLDVAGADEWAHGPHCLVACADCDDDPRAPHIRAALIVARAINGSAS